MTTPTADPQAALAQLQSTLATRESTLHFTHTGVSLIVSMIFAGAAAKLFWDSLRTPLLGGVAALLSLGLVTYAVVRFLRGRKALSSELAQYEQLLALRRQLQLDDPASLLPRA